MMLEDDEEFGQFIPTAGEVHAVYFDEPTEPNNIPEAFRIPVIGWIVIKSTMTNNQGKENHFLHIVPSGWFHSDGGQAETDCTDESNFIGLEFGGKHKCWVDEIKENIARQERVKKIREQKKLEAGANDKTKN